MGIQHDGVRPVLEAGGHTSVTTLAAGATYVAFASALCTQLTLVNTTGTALEVQQDAAGTGLPIPDGVIYTFYGLTNASQLGVRRLDQAVTPVTAKARWEA
jgi:hypothetical protein